jgi:hypothetical protein
MVNLRPDRRAYLPSPSNLLISELNPTGPAVSSRPARPTAAVSAFIHNLAARQPSLDSLVALNTTMVARFSFRWQFT